MYIVCDWVYIEYCACERMSVVAVVLCRIQAVMLDMSLTARISFCHMCVR